MFPSLIGSGTGLDALHSPTVAEKEFYSDLWSEDLPDEQAQVFVIGALDGAGAGIADRLDAFYSVCERNERERAEDV